jgi:hypothetical protein
MSVLGLRGKVLSAETVFYLFEVVVETTLLNDFFVKEF